MAVLRVSYLYDRPLPLPLAAPIQILNTCRALAASGIATTLYTGELHGDPASCLAFYGLQPHPNLAIRPLFSTRAWRLLRPWPLLRVLTPAPARARPVVLARGETAVEAARWLRRTGRRGALFVYEAHRLSFARLAERQSGARWDGSLPRTGAVRRLYERERAALAAADGVVCLTEGVRHALVTLFGLHRPCLVLPSGTSIPTEAAMASAPERDIDVLYVGKLATRKGMRLLLDAMRLLPGRRLCVVGGSPVEVAAYGDLARRHGVAPLPDFPGFVEPWRVPTYLRRSRVGVCPLAPDASVTSEQFTSPLKLLEMMAYGIPVVATDVPSLRAIVTHGETAWLVSPEDPAALAGGIRTLLDDPALADRLATAARQTVRAFSWQERARRLHDFLAALADERPSGARAGVGGHG